MSKAPAPPGRRPPSGASPEGGRRPRRPDLAPTPGEVLEVAVEKLVAGGDGLARIRGVPVFIPRAAPGDRLRIRVTEARRDYARAEIEEIVAPGAGRREPPCPHFGDCGGCDLQHLDDRLQVRLKAAAAREAIERIGGVRWPDEAEVVAGEPWGYRLRTRLRVEAADEGPRVGYLARGSRRLVPVSRCPVLVPELERLVQELPARLPASPPRRIDLAAGGDGALTAAPAPADLPHGEVSRRVAGHIYAYDARCFFQPHGALLPELLERVVGSWTGETVYDLYAGVGLFALPLARRYGRVVAVEGDRIAGRYARLNARRNRLPRVEVLTRAVESWIGALPGGADRVVVDPPRPGLAPVVRRTLLERRPDRITYVSCHPAALGRDLKELCRLYRLDSIALVDLFPQTGHIEVVAQLALEGDVKAD